MTDQMVNHECDSKRRPISIIKDKILIVEGNDDCLFFKALLENMDMADDVQIFIADGRTNFKTKLLAIKKMANFSQKVKSLCIVADSDSNQSIAFSKIKLALEEVGLPIPENPWEKKDDTIKVMIILLPHLNLDGELEDLCLKSIENVPIILNIEEFYTNLESEGFEITDKKSKAILQMYRATKRNLTGLSLGLSAKKGCFCFDDECFANLKNSLNLIFQ